MTRRYFYIAVILVFLACHCFVSTFQHSGEANLTCWRNHRRQKRFILFEHAGISKLVTGITYPVDLNDKRPWRQLVLTFNIQYQFPVPPRPIYYWDKWDDDRSLKESTNDESPPSSMSTDEAQMFLYQFSVELMNRRRMNGLQCLQRAICENAQVDHHDGLFAELVHRLLIPHKSLDSAYLDAVELGTKGFNCMSAFPEAKNCLLDEYLHVRGEVFEDEYNFVS